MPLPTRTHGSLRGGRLRHSVLLLALALLLPGRVATAADREALLRLVAVPAPDFQMNFGWTGRGGFLLNHPFAGDTRPNVELERQRGELTRRLEADPREAELWLTLADLHAVLGATNEAGTASRRAEELLRARLRNEPNNARLRTQLARCLPLPDQAREAEQLHRDAVRLDPTDDFAWTAFGSFLIGQCLLDLGFGSGTPRIDGDSMAEFQSRARERLAGAKVTPEQMTMARNRAAEARTALDRAVKCRHPSVESYLTHWSFNSSSAPVL